ncbi:MAG: hypothetical protein U1F16_07245 [Turneriella sp.]
MSIALVIIPAVTAQKIKVRAVGVDDKRGEIIFREAGALVLREGYMISGQVEFSDQRGVVITRQIIRVTRSAVAPDYTTDDLRDGYREAVRYSDGAYEILSRDHAADPERRVRLQVPEMKISAVTFPGFSNFVHRHWHTLAEGRPVYFYLIVPTRRDYYLFRLVKDRLNGTGDAATLTLRIEPGNFLLRMFVDAIRISFSMKDRRLLRYDGIHFVRDLPKYLGRRLRVSYEYQLTKQ